MFPFSDSFRFCDLSELIIFSFTMDEMSGILFVVSLLKEISCFLLLTAFSFLISIINQKKIIQMGKDRVRVLQLRLKSIIEGLSGSKIFELTGSRKNLLGEFGNDFVGDQGSKLSSGQIQRIGLARALYKKNCKLLIFDEITGNLDERNEIEIIQNITKIKKDVTILFISHNIRLSKYFNKMLKLKNKTIEEVN